MDYKPESEKDPSRKKIYVKPELKRIPLDDEKALLEFCREEPYDTKELKELVNRMLGFKTGQGQNE